MHIPAYIVVHPEVLEQPRINQWALMSGLRGVIEDEMYPFCHGSDHDCPKTEENDYDEQCDHCDNTICNNISVGSFFSGSLVGLDKASNPMNQRLCTHCKGASGLGRATCEHCNNSGLAISKIVEWRTAPYDGDIIPLKEFLARWDSYNDNLKQVGYAFMLGPYGVSDPYTPYKEAVSAGSPLWSTYLHVWFMNCPKDSYVAILDCEM